MDVPELKSRILSLSFVLFGLLFGCSKENVNDGVITPPTTDTLTVEPVNIRGVNWADTRDNFVDGWIILSGLSFEDDYSTVTQKADAVLTGFQTNIKDINTVRLPINPPTVLQTWWNSYKGVTDKAVSKDINVILCCWESASSKNGTVDTLDAFWQMWDTVITRYAGNEKVYFEVFNEPHGYSLSSLSDLYVTFLSRYPNVPKNRILLGGTGYSENVTGIGADTRFAGCLLALHNYGFWTNRSLSEWESDWRSRVGIYKGRTVATEFGASMTTGKNYTAPANGDNEVAYIQGSTNVFRQDNISSVYWPGLRDNDSYSLQLREGTGVNITLTTTNASGLTRIRYGWGY